MNRIVIGLLLVSGFAIAQDQVSAPAQDQVSAPTQAPDQASAPDQAQAAEIQNHMSLWTKLALSTQTPPIHTQKIKDDRVIRQGDRIVEDKTTINAYVPWGK